jgi:hypothetical protein
LPFTDLGHYGTLLCDASSSSHAMPYIRFLFIGPRVCLQLPSDSTSRWTPLPLANSSCCQACSKFAPPSYRPCRAQSSRKWVIIANGNMNSTLSRGAFSQWSRQLKFPVCAENNFWQRKKIPLRFWTESPLLKGTTW